jgi:hypothetical protein
MPLVRPPYLDKPELDSWMNQVTQILNTQLKPESNEIEVLGGTDGLVGADGIDAAHYAEVTLYTDPAVSSAPPAPTATFTWFTAALSGVTAGWSQTPPTIDPTSADEVYYSKITFNDSIEPFATTTDTGTAPVALYNFSTLTTTYLPLAGGTMTGLITFDPGQTFASTKATASFKNTTGGQAVDSTTFVTLTDWADDGVDAAQYSATTGVVTLTRAGTFLVSVTVAAESLLPTANYRWTGEVQLWKNGTTDVATTVGGYIRSNDGADATSITLTKVLTLAASDTLAVRVRRVSTTTGDATTVPGKCHLSFVEL